MLSAEDLQKFTSLRADLFVAIAHSLAADGHCKSYEGMMEICFPNYFDEGDDEGWGIKLHCYVVGPSRHYEWWGRSFMDAFAKAEKDIRLWCEEEMDNHERD